MVNPTTTYRPGVAWHATTMPDGELITWISDGALSAVVSILEPDSDRPARRIVDGRSESVDSPDGLTIYGTHLGDRVSSSEAAVTTPEYAEVIKLWRRGVGATRYFTTAGEARSLTADAVAARLGVQLRTVHRYRHRGAMPQPDDYVGRTPTWLASTIEAWLEKRSARTRSASSGP